MEALLSFNERDKVAFCSSWKILYITCSRKKLPPPVLQQHHSRMRGDSSIPFIEEQYYCDLVKCLSRTKWRGCALLFFEWQYCLLSFTKDMSVEDCCSKEKREHPPPLICKWHIWTNCLLIRLSVFVGIWSLGALCLGKVTSFIQIKIDWFVTELTPMLYNYSHIHTYSRMCKCT